jgi:hypothetical protein
MEIILRYFVVLIFWDKSIYSILKFIYILITNLHNVQVVIYLFFMRKDNKKKSLFIKYMRNYKIEKKNLLIELN